MPGHDLIVVGGSAGGLEATVRMVRGLPADLPAAICIVVHMSPQQRGSFRDMIAAATPLPVQPARHGAPIELGTITVAVPDRHLLIDASPDGMALRVRLTRGPRENRARPAIDPLFRTAALARGSRVIAVVLSGALDDGTAGLWVVRDRGGLAVVQDPEDAQVASMPSSALTNVGADHVARALDLGALLGRLARIPAGEPAPLSPADDVVAREDAVASFDDQAHDSAARYGVPSRFMCPDCGGVLWDVSAEAGGPLRFRCETGHAYSPGALAAAQTEEVEAALSAALRALEDEAAMARTEAERAEQHSRSQTSAYYSAQQTAAEAHAAVIRHMLRLNGRAVQQLPPDEGESARE